MHRRNTRRGRKIAVAKSAGEQRGAGASRARSVLESRCIGRRSRGRDGHGETTHIDRGRARHCHKTCGGRRDHADGYARFGNIWRLARIDVLIARNRNRNRVGLGSLAERHDTGAVGRQSNARRCRLNTTADRSDSRHQSGELLRVKLGQRLQRASTGAGRTGRIGLGAKCCIRAIGNRYGCAAA
jgi:hypothetical protein